MVAAVARRSTSIAPTWSVPDFATDLGGDANIGFGYVMNQRGTEVAHDPRCTALIDALYASL